MSEYQCDTCDYRTSVIYDAACHSYSHDKGHNMKAVADEVERQQYDVDYWCVVCGKSIVGDDTDCMHTDDETGQDCHEECCRTCNG
jgi:DUF2075 family protein